MLLKVENLRAYYNKSQIIQGVSFEVSKGEIIGILGRNGMGKSTLVRSIIGLTPPRTTGLVNFDSVDISSMKAHKITSLGVSYVPQGRHIFPRLTVLENLSVPVTKGKVETESLDEVFGYFPILKERLGQLGGTLSGGQQQMLAIARALMSKPKLIVFDEPTEGAPALHRPAGKADHKIFRDRGITALIADQNLENALELCDRVYVLEKGTIKYTEHKERLSLDLLRVYLGVTRKQEDGGER